MEEENRREKEGGGKLKGRNQSGYSSIEGVMIRQACLVSLEE